MFPLLFQYLEDKESEYNKIYGAGDLEHFDRFIKSAIDDYNQQHNTCYNELETLYAYIDLQEEKLFLEIAGKL